MPGPTPTDRPDGPFTTTPDADLQAAVSAVLTDIATRHRAGSAFSLVMRGQYEDATSVLTRCSVAELDTVIEAAQMLGDLAAMAQSDPNRTTDAANLAVPGV